MARSKGQEIRKKLFASYYLGEARFNATDAVYLAGYKPSSRAVASNMGSELMKDPEVQNFMEQKASEIEITQAEILSELINLARWDHTVQPTLRGIEANAHAKMYDTKMRAKITALQSLQKIKAGDMKDHMEKLEKAYLEHQRIHPEISDTQRAEMFKARIDPVLVDEMLANILKKTANRRLAAEAAAQIVDPMSEGEE